MPLEIFHSGVIGYPVVVSTLWQDEETGMTINSCFRPNLWHDTIEVRGREKESHLKTSSIDLPTVEEAKEFLEKIERTVANFNAYLQSEEKENIVKG